MSYAKRIGAILFCVALAALIWSCATRVKEQHPPIVSSDSTGFRMIGELDFRLLPEASGFSVSRIDNDLLWAINDRGNSASLIAIDTQTMAMTRIPVQGATNRDWEDMAGFRHDGKPWLLIADVGDNQAVRKTVELIFVPEPVGTDALQTAPARTVSMRYPDGARDVEAVAVDVAGDGIYLLSKRTKPPVLYRLPLSTTMAAAVAGMSQPLVAERLGPVNSIPSPTALELSLFPKFGRYRNQPTAMDFSANADTIALLTYGEAYVSRREPGQSVLDALNGTLTRLQMPVLAQPETIAIDATGRVFISTEQAGAPLIVRDLPVTETP